MSKPTITQEITKHYALYNGDCMDVLPSIKAGSVHLTAYSPPFAGLYHYSSDERDLSNCKTPDEFFAQYEFLVRELHRVTMPGRLTAVHCCDIPAGNDSLMDLPGKIIELHQRCGWVYHARYAIWKEPLRVAIRTRSKGLTHRQICKDSSLSNNAGADYMVVFRKAGANPVPITHPKGILKYVGEREVPHAFETPTGEVIPREQFLDWKDPQTNKLAHWIWQQYASAFWDDIRIGRVLEYRHAKEKDEEKHCHPLQLDVVERCCLMWSNPGETVLTPYMGVGSEVYGAVINGRKGIGIELKPSYFRQACANLKGAELPQADQRELLDIEEPQEAPE